MLARGPPWPQVVRCLFSGRRPKQARTFVYRSGDDDCAASATGIAAAGEFACLGVARAGLPATAVEVALLPALHGPAAALERIERPWVHAGLGLDDATLEMKARQLDSAFSLQVEVDDVDDRLQDRRTDPVRTG